MFGNLKLIFFWLGRNIESIFKSFCHFLYLLFFSFLFFDISFAETASQNYNFDKRGLTYPKKIENIKSPEAPFKRVYVVENMVPLPFKKFPYKPVYKGEISDEIKDKSKKVKETAKNQIVSNFDLNEQKRKDRKKNERELIVFNEGKNKKFFDYFKSIERVRVKPANYSGFHYDYSKFLQNFKIITKR
tara:strand:+ start:459 stop:1022 length:564 start_codon:yes stop_codon:yes gene_type:complete